MVLAASVSNRPAGMSIVSGSNTIKSLVKRYPQLDLPIAHDEKNTLEYKNAVLRGSPVSYKPEFITSADDRLETVETPVGNVDVLYLSEREDFVHAYRALAYRCEPVEIPDSVGAGIISGLINWEKIHRHMEAFLPEGTQEYSEEFKKFTADKANYIDSFIILSSGYYSAIEPEKIGLPAEEWKEKSYIIRKYHELTHFICRKLYPENKDAVRDEVVADMIGITAAFGEYDIHLAELFLGIEKDCFREGGRLLHYLTIEKISKDVEYINAIIDKYRLEMSKIKYSGWNGENLFSTIQDILECIMNV